MEITENVISDAVCTTGNIIGLINCERSQGGQCLQRGPSEAYCACPVGTTGIDCAGRSIAAGAAAAFPPMFGRPPFLSTFQSFNIPRPFQRYSPFLSGYQARIPGRRLLTQVPSGKYASHSEAYPSNDEEENDDGLP